MRLWYGSSIAYVIHYYRRKQKSRLLVCRSTNVQVRGVEGMLTASPLLPNTWLVNNTFVTEISSYANVPGSCCDTWASAVFSAVCSGYQLCLLLCSDNKGVKCVCGTVVRMLTNALRPLKTKIANTVLQRQETKQEVSRQY